MGGAPSARKGAADGPGALVAVRPDAPDRVRGGFAAVVQRVCRMHIGPCFAGAGVLAAAVGNGRRCACAGQGRAGRARAHPWVARSGAARRRTTARRRALDPRWPVGVLTRLVRAPVAVRTRAAVGRPGDKGASAAAFVADAVMGAVMAGARFVVAAAAYGADAGGAGS